MAGNPLLISLDLLVADGLAQPHRSGRGRAPARGPGRFRPRHPLEVRAASPGGSVLGRAIADDERELGGRRSRPRRRPGWTTSSSSSPSRRSRAAGPGSSGRATRARASRRPSPRRARGSPTGCARMRSGSGASPTSGRRCALRRRARRALLGDLPIFVAHDSADVWMRPDLFHLDDEGRPTVVAGVPPDYFSKTGQLWGNPLYDWERHARRLRLVGRAACARLSTPVDLVRIDHFRGFEAYWEVPAAAETAARRQWVPGPGTAFFARCAAAGRPADHRRGPRRDHAGRWRRCATASDCPA